MSLGVGHPVRHAGLRAGETVLDLGCGAGIDTLLAARAVGPTGHVIGLDMTPEMVERARRNAAAATRDNVEVRQGLIEEIPLPDASVDVVVSNGVLNLSTRKSRVLAESFRVLRQEGESRSPISCWRRLCQRTCSRARPRSPADWPAHWRRQCS